MKKDYVLPEKQYGVCPKCGLTINKTRETKKYVEMTCTTCNNVWKANFKYGYEDMIISETDLPNKEKKKQKEYLIIKYEALKEGIENSKKIDDLRVRHDTLTVLDDEFKILCPKKYNAYFAIGEFKTENEPFSYRSYLNNRSYKMIRDINKILFYFGR